MDIIMNEKDFLKRYEGSSENYRYMLLDRMRSDCDYVLDACHGNPYAFKFLWAYNNPQAHIAYMRYLWNSLAEKPEWLSMEQIDEYERRLCK